MPRNESGTMALTGVFAPPNSVASSATTNAFIDDITGEITKSLARNGQGSMLADLEMGSHKIIDLLPGTLSSDAATLGQIGTLTGNNTWTGNQTIEKTDDSATIGPTVVLRRISASPAATDLLGEIRFDGKDSAAATIPYASLGTYIIDPVIGTAPAGTDGGMFFSTNVAGTVGARLYIGKGIWTSGATGTDMGADSINANDYYIKGSSLLKGSISFSHGQPSNTRYIAMLSAPWPFTITKITHRTESGTCTATWRINSTDITGGGGAVTSSTTILTPTAANTAGTASYVDVNITAVSGAIGYDASVEILRTG